MEVHRRVVLCLVLLLTIISKHVNEASILNEAVNNVVHSIETGTSTSDLTSNTTEMITNHGYLAEEHYVTTEDGYILKMNRIKKFLGPVVLIIHGLLNSADDWITRGEDALPFQLADAGFDVYLGNVRGNKYCRNHTHLSPNERPFWNFSFHEMGLYDLPAMIDYSLKTSNKFELTYIGHSQGTTSFFIMASLRPEYNDKVSLMISMATIAWLYHVRTPVLRAPVPLRDELVLITDSMGIYDLLAYDAFWRFITTRVCPSNKFNLFICASVLFSVYGFDYGQLNYTQFSRQIGHIPAGASVKQFVHYAQFIANNEFRQFDYKTKSMNFEVYGSEDPPSYPVEKITARIAIMHGKNDLISSYEDVRMLTSKLPNVIDEYIVPIVKWNHMDFLWGKDANSTVYKKALDLIIKYSRM